ncbi:MAG TPA: DEAD/DEAH box helicase [Thermoplasmata archaeon]|nr:DEAD/DEAH box helicase [Thermoplasmata archaeon]
MTDPAAALLPGIDGRLAEAMARRGIREPTEIQRLALPLLEGGADALLLSPTGTGKTEAVLLPLLSRRLADSTPAVSILYVTPLRALNRDLEHRLVSLVEEVGLTAAVRHGDTTASARLAQSRHPPDLLLTTPETLQVLLVGRKLRESLRNVRTVVVDEIHELVGSDRGAQLGLTLERLDELAGRKVRRIGLSATVGNPADVARFLSPEPRAVEVRSAVQRRLLELSARRPSESYPPLDPELLRDLKADAPLLAALRAVEEEVRAHVTTLIFVNTRPTAEGLAARLSRLAPDLSVAVHHGSLSREMREEAERAFREGRLRALVATSSLELGIDIGSVDHVIQFGSPHQVGRLVQRVGRSGHRQDRVIHGTVLALDDDDLEEAAVLARRADEGLVEPASWRTRNRLAAAQQVIGALRAEGAVAPARLVEVLGRAAAARDLSRSDWEALFDYLVALRLAKRLDDGRIAPGRGTLPRFYAALSLIPDERTYRLRDIATRRLIGTLDERFVLTQILAQPEEIFLLHGRTWKVVEYRDGELLVETVQEIGAEPRWAGEDLPVPFDVAQEIGRLRREGDLEGYPIGPVDRHRLAGRREAALAAAGLPTDRRVTVTARGRVVVYGACFGTRTNETLALAVAGLLTARLGARTEVASVEPTWFVLELPVAVDGPTLVDAFSVDPEALLPLVERLVPSGLDYRWVFLAVGRKLGVIPASADPRDLRTLQPLLEQSRVNPLGEEVLDKTLHDRFDVDHAREVLRRVREGSIEVVATAPSALTDGPLERLSWRAVSDIPPPTLLKAVRERLSKEPLVLVCLRCGFTRQTTPARYQEEGGSRCLLCHGSLSAVLSPRREKDIERLLRYAKAKWRPAGHAPKRGARRERAPSPELEALVRAGYTSAELVAHYGDRALYALAARGIGPETARRLLARLYRDDDAFFTEILRAERSYAKTRAFWD